MKFEKFSRKSVLHGIPSARLSKKQLVFSTVSYEKFLKGFDYVELFFSKEEHAVGVLPVKEATTDSFHIKTYRSQKSPVTMVNCKNFIDHYELPTGSFPVEQDKKGMLIIHLKEKTK